MKRIIRTLTLTMYTLLISMAALEISGEPSKPIKRITISSFIISDTISSEFDTVIVENNSINIVTSSYDNSSDAKTNKDDKKKAKDEEHEGYVIFENVKLREKPNKKSETLCKIEKVNTKITYTNYNKDWVKLCYKEEIGFIKKDYISKKKISKEELEKRNITCDKAYTCSRFRRLGKVRYGGHTYTWYSQRVLPGGGLRIPGRHVNKDGLICDKDGYICVAVDFLPKGSIVNTPLGIKGKVYDCGAGCNNIDIYCNW